MGNRQPYTEVVNLLLQVRAEVHSI